MKFSAMPADVEAYQAFDELDDETWLSLATLASEHLLTWPVDGQEIHRLQLLGLVASDEQPSSTGWRLLIRWHEKYQRETRGLRRIFRRVSNERGDFEAQMCDLWHSVLNGSLVKAPTAPGRRL